MKKPASWIVPTIVVCSLLAPAVVHLLSSGPTRECGPVSWELNAGYQTGIALGAYASDHGGNLPQNLSELVPAYAGHSKILDQMTLHTPGAMLGSLPRNVIIASRPAREPRHTIAVYPDLYVETLR